MKLRRAVTADAAALAAVETLQPQAAGWGESGFQTELAQPCAVMYCAVDESTVLGYAAARAVEDTAEILNVAVHPRQARQGIGTALLQSLLDQLRKQQIRQVTLEVAQDNTPAQALYAKAGFAPCALRKDFYGAGRHALILRKEL